MPITPSDWREQSSSKQCPSTPATSVSPPPPPRLLPLPLPLLQLPRKELVRTTLVLILICFSLTGACRHLLQRGQSCVILSRHLLPGAVLTFEHFTILLLISFAASFCFFLLLGCCRYAERGNVCSMFPWQAECLSTDGGACVMRGHNLIYSAVSHFTTLHYTIILFYFLSDNCQHPAQAKPSIL